MSLRKKLLTAVVLAGATTALLSSSAAAFDGKVYMGAGGGWTHMDDGWASPEFSINDGWIADGRVGVQPKDSHFRYELDLSYRSYDTSGIGGINMATAFGNVLYDFPTGINIHPYLGAGLGFARLEFTPKGAGYNYHTKATTPGIQGIAGVEWQASRHLSFDVEYRYLALDNPKITGTAGTLVGAREAFGNHAVLAGLRWTFGAAPPPAAPAPPPPPPPPPPPAQPTVFKIFFPWDQYTLTPEARKTVDEIASQYKTTAAHIHIEGNTDTSGAAGYNMRLGAKRADSVKTELIGQGISSGIIDTVSMGETNPAVKTGNNVREPLNRRAEVTIKLIAKPQS